MQGQAQSREMTAEEAALTDLLHATYERLWFHPAEAADWLAAHAYWKHSPWAVRRETAHGRDGVDPAIVTLLFFALYGSDLLCTKVMLTRASRPGSCYLVHRGVFLKVLVPVSGPASMLRDVIASCVLRAALSSLDDCSRNLMTFIGALRVATSRYRMDVVCVDSRDPAEEADGVDACAYLEIDGAASLLDMLPLRDDGAKALDRLFKSMLRIGAATGFRHNDVHAGNLLFNEATRNFVLIDYGSATFSASTLRRDPGLIRDMEAEFVRMGRAVDGGANRVEDHPDVVAVFSRANDAWANGRPDLPPAVLDDVAGAAFIACSATDRLWWSQSVDGERVIVLPVDPTRIVDVMQSGCAGGAADGLLDVGVGWMALYMWTQLGSSAANKMGSNYVVPFDSLIGPTRAVRGNGQFDLGDGDDDWRLKFGGSKRTASVMPRVAAMIQGVLQSTGEANTTGLLTGTSEANNTTPGMASTDVTGTPSRLSPHPQHERPSKRPRASRASRATSPTSPSSPNRSFPPSPARQGGGGRRRVSSSVATKRFVAAVNRADDVPVVASGQPLLPRTAHSLALYARARARAHALSSPPQSGDNAPTK
jgi:hypothetical protein